MCAVKYPSVTNIMKPCYCLWVVWIGSASCDIKRYGCAAPAQLGRRSRSFHQRTAEARLCHRACALGHRLTEMAAARHTYRDLRKQRLRQYTTRCITIILDFYCTLIVVRVFTNITRNIRRLCNYNKIGNFCLNGGKVTPNLTKPIPNMLRKIGVIKILNND